MKRKTGTREWSSHSLNIVQGCSNGCLYCYAKANALRFKRITSHAEWTAEIPKPVISRYPRHHGESLVMFPTAHDITPGTLSEFLRVARLVLETGNQLLIVSKPRLDCIRTVISELEQWKAQVLLRYSIGTLSRDVALFWEPTAPSPSLRIQALYESQAAGWKTSVSLEPMLEGSEGAFKVLEAVSPYVSDTIWVGKMNLPRLRVDMSTLENRLAVEQVEALQNDEQIRNLVYRVETDPELLPIVRWKDSIRKIVCA